MCFKKATNNSIGIPVQTCSIWEGARNGRQSSLSALLCCSRQTHLLHQLGISEMLRSCFLAGLDDDEIELGILGDELVPAEQLTITRDRYMLMKNLLL